MCHNVQQLQRIEMGGHPTEFQYNISLDAVEALCASHKNLKALRFEYCAKIGESTI